MVQFMTKGAFDKGTAATRQAACLCNSCELFGCCGRSPFPACPPLPQRARKDYAFSEPCKSCDESPGKTGKKCEEGPCKAVYSAQM